MPQMSKWIDRVFKEQPDPGSFNMILERLRGTPVRVEEKVHSISPRALATRHGDAWSLQEHVGHLLDLEPLWEGRFDDFRDGCDTLRAADMSNRKTYEANHNKTDIIELLARFREAREVLVARLERFSEDDVVATALHPRLQQPMRAIDLTHFIAEHDDHHLATMSEIIRRHL